MTVRRLAELFLVASVAAWGLLGAFDNLEDPRGAAVSVASVASMSTFAGGANSWRATSSSGAVAAGVACIVLFKAISAFLCVLGAWRMSRALNGERGEFESAKAPAIAGCAVAVFGLFLGWIVIGEGWFEMWRSDALRDAAAQTAFRHGALIALIGLLVGAGRPAGPAPTTSADHGSPRAGG